MRFLSDLNPKAKTILLRADYNLPLDSHQNILSDFRLRASLPTIEHLLENGATKIVITSHLGRPGSRPDPLLSLRPVAARLSALLSRPVEFIPAVSGTQVTKTIDSMPKGSIILLENLRFYPGEEQNSLDFSRDIVVSSRADAFVQDGFAVIHREHASTSRFPSLLPAYAGLLLEQEITTLSHATKSPARPLVLILGGAKVADKQPLIDHFSSLADQIFIGGKIAADGYRSNHSNVTVATTFNTDSAGQKLDLDSSATDDLLSLISSAKTIIWNGTLGLTEQPPFDQSSTRLATFLGTHPEITSIICGGDTTSFIEKLQSKFPNLHFSLLSTGGGASLEFLLSRPLPGLQALENSSPSSIKL